MDLFGAKRLDEGSHDFLPHVWGSLFLVIPVVSSTFASIAGMLDDLPPESLGWLLVDEAGQGVPQAAVGALMRAKRAVIVGDPLQIEPVVTMPEEFTSNVFEHFGVGSERFNAPAASVQTLADAAGAFQDELGETRVGVPLLVHQRCHDPMFGVSNKGHRTDNPANDAIDILLPSSAHKTKHRESVAVEDVAQVVAKFETVAHASRLGAGMALRFFVLTAAQTSEVLRVRWS